MLCTHISQNFVPLHTIIAHLPNVPATARSGTKLPSIDFLLVRPAFAFTPSHLISKTTSTTWRLPHTSSTWAPTPTVTLYLRQNWPLSRLSLSHETLDSYIARGQETHKVSTAVWLLSVLRDMPATLHAHLANLEVFSQIRATISQQSKRLTGAPHSGAHMFPCQALYCSVWHGRIESST